MAKGIKRQLKYALRNVNRVISDFAAHDALSGALAGEGYNGGYRDALNDVILALNGVLPTRNRWWGGLDSGP